MIHRLQIVFIVAVVAHVTSLGVGAQEAALPVGNAGLWQRLQQLEAEVRILREVETRRRQELPRTDATAQAAFARRKDEKPQPTDSWLARIIHGSLSGATNASERPGQPRNTRKRLNL